MAIGTAYSAARLSTEPVDKSGAKLKVNAPRPANQSPSADCPNNGQIEQLYEFYTFYCVALLSDYAFCAGHHLFRMLHERIFAHVDNLSPLKRFRGPETA